MTPILIKAPSLFSAKESLQFLNRSSKECLFTLENQKVRRLLRYDRNHFLLDFYLENDAVIKVEFPEVDLIRLEVEYVKQYVIRWLGLEDDLESFYNVASADAVLGPLIKKYAGLRLIGIPDLFEALCWAIIGQQINLSFAYTIKSRFVRQFGTRHHFKGTEYYHFPGPERVIQITKEQLLSLKFSRQKADYILGIANSFVERRLDPLSLSRMSYTDAKTKLMSFRGIGNWSADYVLMKTLKHPQAFPVQDAGFLNALKTQLGLPAKPDLEMIRQIAKPWKGYEALATFYLWRSLME